MSIIVNLSLYESINQLIDLLAGRVGRAIWMLQKVKVHIKMPYCILSVIIFYNTYHEFIETSRPETFLPHAIMYYLLALVLQVACQ